MPDRRAQGSVASWWDPRDAFDDENQLVNIVIQLSMAVMQERVIGTSQYRPSKDTTRVQPKQYSQLLLVLNLHTATTD
jgi:hypothetical protein